MVGTVDVAFDPSITDIVPQFGRHEEIIQAPADIPFTSTGLVRPPAIGASHIAMHMAERIHIARVHKPVHPRALLRQETRVMDILLRAGEIYLAVRDIEVTTDYNGLLDPKFLGILKEGIKKAHLVRHTLEDTLGKLFAPIREIDVEEMQFRELKEYLND